MPRAYNVGPETRATPHARLSRSFATATTDLASRMWIRIIALVTRVSTADLTHGGCRSQLGLMHGGCQSSLSFP